MSEERIILEINPRTKEKKLVNVLDLKIEENYTVRDLIEEHRKMQMQIKALSKLNNKLIDVVKNINKATKIQIVEIKEEIK